MMERIARIAFYVLLPLGVFVLLGFANQSNKAMPCSNLRVVVKEQKGLHFVDTSKVKQHINKMLDSVVGRSLRDINLKDIERVVADIYYVQKADVYRTIDGEVVVRIEQREPIARVINTYNESYYITRRGNLMKTSDNYTARVVVVTGHVHARHSSNIDLCMPRPEDVMPASEQLLRDVYTLVDFISNDPFYDALIDQIYVTRAGKFELIPKNASHVIELGSIENIQEKFDKLLSFYKLGLSNVGWNSYRRINLQYSNQVVCSK